MNNGLNCQSCIEQFKKLRNCDGTGKPYVAEGIEVDRCPVKIVSVQSMIYVEAYKYYAAGQFPFSGTYLEQPLKYMEAMKLIDGIVYQEQVKQMNKRRKNAKH